MLTTLWLLVTFNSFGLAFEPESMIKLQMDFIIGFDGRLYKSMDLVKEALLYTTDIFEISPNYTKAGIFAFGKTMTHVMRMSGELAKVRRIFSELVAPNEPVPSVMKNALDNMCYYSYEADRIASLKLYLMITSNFPEDMDGNQDWSSCELETRVLRNQGLYFMIFHDYQNQQEDRIAYLRTLVGDNKSFIHIQNDASMKEQVQKIIIPTVVELVCSQKTRFCRFTTLRRDECESLWYYKSDLIESEECSKMKLHDPPDSCNVEECFEKCDELWPWQEDTLECDCELGRKRENQNPMPKLLQFCPRIIGCPECDVTVDDRKWLSTDQSILGNKTESVRKATTPDDGSFWQMMNRKAGPFPLWAIGVIAIGVLLSLAVLMIALICLSSLRKKRRLDRPPDQGNRSLISFSGGASSLKQILQKIDHPDSNRADDRHGNSRLPKRPKSHSPRRR